MYRLTTWYIKPVAAVATAPLAACAKRSGFECSLSRAARNDPIAKKLRSRNTPDSKSFSGINSSNENLLSTVMTE